jgi:hypothetical protein
VPDGKDPVQVRTLEPTKALPGSAPSRANFPFISGNNTSARERLAAAGEGKALLKEAFLNHILSWFVHAMKRYFLPTFG